MKKSISILIAALFMVFAVGSIGAEADTKKRAKARTAAVATASGFGFKTVATPLDMYGVKTYQIAPDIEARLQKAGFRFADESSGELFTSDDTAVPAVVKSYEKDGIRVNYSASADPSYEMNGLSIDFPDIATRDKFVASAKAAGYKFFTTMKCYSLSANFSGLCFSIDGNTLNFEFVN